MSASTQEKDKKNPISPEKKRKLIVATTIGGILLACILLCVMIYQIIAIETKKRDVAHLESVIAQLEQDIENGEDTLEIRQTKEWILRRAAELGYDIKEWEDLLGDV